MASIEQRLQKIESTIKEEPQRPLTRAEAEAQESAWFASYGLSRDEVMTKYGGTPAFAYAAMLGDVKPLNAPPPAPESDDGLSAAERYMQMLNG